MCLLAKKFKILFTDTCHISKEQELYANYSVSLSLSHAKIAIAYFIKYVYCWWAWESESIQSHPSIHPYFCLHTCLLYFCLSICTCVYQCFTMSLLSCLPVWLPPFLVVCLSACLFTFLPVCLSVCVSVFWAIPLGMPVYQFAQISVCSSSSLSIWVSVSLFACLSSVREMATQNFN